MTNPDNNEAPQPDPHFVIQTLMEENRSLYDNKLYLVALVKQLQNEFADAKATWVIERESLKKETEEQE